MGYDSCIECCKIILKKDISKKQFYKNLEKYYKKLSSNQVTSYVDELKIKNKTISLKNDYIGFDDSEQLLIFLATQVQGGKMFVDGDDQDEDRKSVV